MSHVFVVLYDEWFILVYYFIKKTAEIKVNNRDFLCVSDKNKWRVIDVSHCSGLNHEGILMMIHQLGCEYCEWNVYKWNEN